MRRAFVRKLVELARRDRRIVFLTGDLGFMALEPFRDEFPDRFLNVGIAEQNMVGIATGLAEAGFLPFAYSIATFAALRPFEFIRNGPVLHRLPVRVVGMGAGFEYAHAGPTHHAVEDIAILRTQAALCVVVPADHEQATTALERTWDLPGPVYYSMGKDDHATIPGLHGRFRLAEVDVVCEGSDAVLITMGAIAAEVVAAAEELRRLSVRSTVALVSSFNPDPEVSLARVLARARVAVTVEAQVVSGGLGALVAQIVANRAMSCRVTSLAVSRSPDGRSGNQTGMWRLHGLDRRRIVEAVVQGMACAS